MSVVKNGDTVKVHYTGQLEDGSVFDSSVQREPLEFTLGQGQLIPGFEKAVVGLNNVTIDANHPLAGKDLTFNIELVEIA